MSMSLGLCRMLLVCFFASAAAAQSGVRLELLGRYDAGVGEGAAEISAYDSLSQRLFVVNSTHGGLDILSLANPASPSLVRTIDISAFGASANSVAAKNGAIAVAVQAAAVDGAGKVLFVDSEGAVLNSVDVGVLPDMLIFTPDGSKVLVANEGEPSADYSIDPEGSVSIIDIASGVVSASVRQVSFAAFNGREAALRAQGVRIFGPNASAAQDFEPEYIAVSADGATAYVSMQEANAFAIVDIASASVTAIKALGFKDHSKMANAFDASNRDGGIHIRPWPTLGMYMPDAIAAFSAAGKTYIVSANEGDSRDYAGFSEETRVGDLILDPTAFPDAATLQLAENLGRLKTTTAQGDTDGDGDHDIIYSYGARSFSIWDDSGELVYDSGALLARLTAQFVAEGFNSNSGIVDEFDERSDDKGAEPEGVTTGVIAGRTYAFIGLERTGGIATFDVTDPQHPFFVDYINSRDFAAGVGDVSPEGLLFVSASGNATGDALLIASHEVSGTVAVFAVKPQSENFKLTVLHNNDGESELINAGEGLEDFGGVARFKTLVDQLKTQAQASGRGVVMLSSGDNFLAGPEFNASLKLSADRPYYDAVAMDLIGYDAVDIGNHDFDFGPDVLQRFIASYSQTRPPYLSSNLDFGQESGLQALKDAGRIAASTVLDVRGEKVGVVGATTPDITFISSPRKVVVNAVLPAVQAEVDRLTGQGIDKIILISHLQSLNNDRALATQLRDVDIVIAGGGDELLANANNALIPGAESAGAYPQIVQDAAGDDVYIVTTEGQYRYVGRLQVEFDSGGRVVSVGSDSGPVRVAGGSHADAVAADPTVQALVVDPVQAAVGALAGKVIGVAEVVLDGQRTSVRTRESNEGNLIADALLWQARQVAASFGAKQPDVALQNGGGIRNANEVPAGNISELTTFSMLPFANFLTVVEDIPARQFVEILENAVSQVENSSGRFAQIAGFSMVYNANGQAQVLDDNGNVVTPGRRIVSAVLDDGRVIVENGRLLTSAAPVTIATIDFLAGGGDQYPYRGAPFTKLGFSYQQALANYIADGLNGRIAAVDYPLAGSGRIRTGTVQAARADKAQKAVVRATLSRPNAAVEGLLVEFSRAISGLPRSYEWSGSVGASGQVEIAIETNNSSAGATGYYTARAIDPASGAVVGRWRSIPLNGDTHVEVLLPIGGRAEVTAWMPLDAAKEIAVAAAPLAFALHANYPNPFNAETQLSYTLARPGQVRLVVYNALGQRMRTLVDQFQAAGSYRLAWDGRDDGGRGVSSGLYFYRLEHAAGVHMRHMLLLK